VNPLSRRDLARLASMIIPIRLPWNMRAFANEPSAQEKHCQVTDQFPIQSPELVREMVTVSHFDQKRVRELVEARPSLARAAWDWGFGDWETALGAASHMGNRPIAEYLISKGARPSLFSATMLGQLEVVRAFIAAQPGAQRVRGPHSISLLDHAKAGGPEARAVLDFLESMDGAGDEPGVSLSDVDRVAVLGTYVFGFSPSQQIDITMEYNPMLKMDQLTWTRKGTMGRPLYHVGDRVFYPAGAAAVRIRFTEEMGTVVMTVSDPDIVLRAQRRKQEPSR